MPEEMTSEWRPEGHKGDDLAGVREKRAAGEWARPVQRP